MSDLDDINHNVQLGNLGQIAGRIQQSELIRQQEELLDFKRKEHEERKRKSELPKCPAYQSSVEKKSTVCPQCGLRITVFKIDSFWSSVQICATKNLGQVIQSTVSSLTKLQTEPIQKLSVIVKKLSHHSTYYYGLFRLSRAFVTLWYSMVRL